MCIPRMMMAPLLKVNVVLVSLLFLLHIGAVSCIGEGALRLVNGGYNYQGVLEIFHEGAWGLIDKNDWDFRDAEVACKQLGYPGAALSDVPFDLWLPAGNVWLTRVNCRGDEESLLDCDTPGLGNTDPEWRAVVMIQCRVSSYLGCAEVTDPASPILSGKSVSDVNVSVVSCLDTCRRDGFPYAAVQAPDQCLCGTYGETLMAAMGASLDQCNTTCPGDHLQVCGGTSSMSVYDVSLGGCGGKLFGRNMGIVSPGFPGNYPAGFTCRWVADVSVNSYTTVRLPVLDLATGDQLEISLHGDTFTLGHRSSFEPHVAESLSNVTVTFTSGVSSRGAGGFMLTLTLHALQTTSAPSTTKPVQEPSSHTSLPPTTTATGDGTLSCGTAGKRSLSTHLSGAAIAAWLLFCLVAVYAIAVTVIYIRLRWSRDENRPTNHPEASFLVEENSLTSNGNGETMSHSRL